MEVVDSLGDCFGVKYIKGVIVLLEMMVSVNKFFL